MLDFLIIDPLHASSFWPKVGEFALSLSLGTAVYSIVASFWGGHTRNSHLKLSGEFSLYAAATLITISILILISQFLLDNFWLKTVYGYSNREMPVIYKITALWGGQEGSLLFWLWLAALFAAVSIFTHRKSDPELTPYATSVFGVILSFFGFLILYFDNPFELFPQAPENGRGLNPLLQNPSMAIHPPTLYLGYVGLAVPYAFAMAALLSKRLDSRWIQTTRLWTLVAWFFLSVGNLLGSQWAYVELGWGGFWAWDPVENAALMPWLTASAFIHSVMIQERRGMLKFWNLHLVTLSYALTLLGTYLTRSGVVQSVHSFARSEIGYFFIGFLLAMMAISWALIYWRRDDLKSANVFESFFSKESAFVLNNIALVGAAFIILWCTLFPTASEVIIGTRIIVGPPFFNQMLAPIGILLLILTGIGPMIAWKKASDANLKRSFTWPTIIGFVLAAVCPLLGIYAWYVVATVFGSGFVLTTIVMEFYQGSYARVRQHGESWWVALLRATFRNNRKYGGYIVHIGLVFMFLGIAGSAYKEIFEFDLKPGGSASFREYTIQFKDFKSLDKPNHEENFALIDLYVGDRFVQTMKPARFFYKAQQQPSTEVDIYSRWKEDVYFTLGSVEPQTMKTKIHITLNPLISWLWAGGLILVIGALIAMMPPLQFKSATKTREES